MYATDSSRTLSVVSYILVMMVMKAKVGVDKQWTFCSNTLVGTLSLFDVGLSSRSQLCANFHGYLLVTKDRSKLVQARG